MAERDIHRRQQLAPSPERALFDPHPERREPQLGVAHEREQRLEGRQLGRQCRDLRQALAERGGEDGGTVPEAGRHRRPIMLDPMEIASDTFRQVMGRFATGISVVTTFEDGHLGSDRDFPTGKPAGITVNALSSVSLEPPLVMVALDRRRFITPMVRRAGRYAVNVLGEDQQALSDCFAHAPGRAPAARRSAAPPGTPARPACRCSTARSRPSSARSSRRSRAGDHDLFIGRVDSLDAATDEPDAAPAALLPAPLPADRAGRRQPRRRQAGGLSADDPGERARHRLRGRSAPGRRWCCSTARRRSGARTSRPSCRSSSKAFRVYLPDARGHGRTRWDAAEGFGYDWLVDDLAAFVDALGLRHVPPRRLLDGRDDGAPVRGPRAGAAADAGGRRDHDAARAARERRAAADGPGADPGRDDPAFARDPARRHDAGQGVGAWQRLLPAIAADIAAQPLLTPRRAARRSTARRWSSAATATRSCRWSTPRALARQLPDGRLFVAPDCGHEVMARRPGLFNEALAGFYRSTEASRARAAHDSRRATEARTKEDPHDHAARALSPRPRAAPRPSQTFERRYRDEHLPLVAQTPGPARDPRLAGRRGAGRRDGPRRSPPRWTSTIGPRSTRASAPTRCGPPAGSSARSRRGWRLPRPRGRPGPARAATVDGVPQVAVDTVGTRRGSP